MLKYLFAAQYNDGTIFYQDQHDISLTNPKKSQFYDVLQREKDIVAFALHGDGHQYSVSLDDGHFEIDGIAFQVYDAPIENRRLVFFRRHTHNVNIDYEEQSHYVQYHFGWQGNVPGTGENIQRVINIS
jgi:hypothetical protein